MKLEAVARIGQMTPWEVIEEALARRKPPQKPQWLADRLGVTAQVMTNWKRRGVPAARYRAIAEALGLTVDQVEGVAPPPWRNEAGWPFPDIEQSRFQKLTELQKGEVQAKVRELIAAFERAESGKSPPSSTSTGQSRRAA